MEGRCAAERHRRCLRAALLGGRILQAHDPLHEHLRDAVGVVDPLARRQAAPLDGDPSRAQVGDEPAERPQRDAEVVEQLNARRRRGRGRRQRPQEPEGEAQAVSRPLLDGSPPGSYRQPRSAGRRRRGPSSLARRTSRTPSPASSASRAGPSTSRSRSCSRPTPVRGRRSRRSSGSTRPPTAASPACGRRPGGPSRGGSRTTGPPRPSPGPGCSPSGRRAPRSSGRRGSSPPSGT